MWLFYRMKKIRKAVIPAAGLGTRFLPATKTVPKEMLPIIDKPIILFIVEEAVRAGIEDIVLIAGRHKTAIEDFFDCSYELQDTLVKQGKIAWLEQLLHIQKLANIISVRQKQALGLGHAVLCGHPIIGNEPFAVLLGDEIMCAGPGERTVTEDLAITYSENKMSGVAIMPVSDSEVSKYGIIEGTPISEKQFRVSKLMEKPSASETSSRWAMPGRYVFDPKIFDYLKNTKPGKNGEIQLTDAMIELAKNDGLIATKFSSRRFDAGDKFGFLQANIELGLEHPDLGTKFKEYIIELSKRLS